MGLGRIGQLYMRHRVTINDTAILVAIFAVVAYIAFVWRGNQPGNSVNLDESVARSVTKGGRSPTGGAFLATARTHVGVHAVW